jgi:ubiquinone biosynthesis protein UbiJ
VPADVSQLLSHLFGEVLDGRNAQVTDGVQRALGRPARDFADYAAAHAEEWRVAQPVT